MTFTASLRRQLGPAALAGAMLTLLAAPAHAQPQSAGVLNLRENAQFIVLEARVTKLEQNPDVFKLRADMEARLSKLQLEVALLRTDLTVQQSMINGLMSQVAALEARKPGDPGKASDPVKPADGQVLSLLAPFTVKDASGRVIFKVDAVAGNLPRAIVGNPAGARVEIGIAEGGASVVGLYDPSGKILSALVGDPQGSYLRVKDNEQSASLGKTEKDGVGLYLRKDDKQFGELSVGKTGYGIARVFGADGKAVGGLFASAEGGGLALTGPGGGKSVVSLGVTPSGGKVRVYPAGGGSVRAELVAEGNLGALNIYSSDGTNAATITSVTSLGGKFELTNASGQVVVQAGHQPNGRGMVTTGPFEGGLAGTLGSGLTPASTIVGQMKGK
jgi:hypothetical protein